MTTVMTKFTVTELQFHVFIPRTLKGTGILAFGELWCLDDTGDTVFKVKGFVLKEKLFKDEPTKVVDFPAFKSGGTYKKSFFFENRNIYFQVCKGFLDEYQKQINTDFGYSNQTQEHVDVNPDDLPF